MAAVKRWNPDREAATRWSPDAKAVWEARTAIMVRMAGQGAPHRFIGAVLGVAGSTVSRRLQAIEGRGGAATGRGEIPS